MAKRSLKKVRKVNIAKQRVGSGLRRGPGSVADWHCRDGRWNQGASCAGGRFNKYDAVSLAQTLLKEVQTKKR
jgi:hypothetical protein